jgi:hypothetical protein
VDNPYQPHGVHQVDSPQSLDLIVDIVKLFIVGVSARAKVGIKTKRESKSL